MKHRLNQLYIASVAIVTVATLVYVYVKPLHSMQVDRDGIAHFTPPVINPDTGDAIDLGTLVRHYQGD